MSIPIEFLMKRMDIRVRVGEDNFNHIIDIRCFSRNKMCQYRVSKQNLREYYLFDTINEKKLNPINHTIISNMIKLIPEFEKMDIDYTFLENYKGDGLIVFD